MFIKWQSCISLYSDILINFVVQLTIMPMEITNIEATAAPRLDVRGLSIDDLKDFCKSVNEPAFRAKQIYEWLWQKSAHSFDEMTNLSKKLRTTLQEQFEIRAIKLDMQQNSEDGTVKMRYRLFDGHLIESVLIPVPEKDRFTVCISTQVGCSLTCKFCATGKMKRLRNLEASEIYDQVVLVNRACLEIFEKPITNVVYMGMGEPLLAYRPVLESVHWLTSTEGLNMAAKRLTISTAGIAKMIRKLADDGIRTNLALSLHAADDEKRNKIMPINEQNNLEELIESLRYFYQHTKDSKITFEYIAFKDFNDGMDDAKKLLQICRAVPTAKVNIIEYNPIDGEEFEKADEDKINAFAQYIRSHDIAITVRRSRGKDIDAACGQLANK
jgi:23S rRNA (adenine2503-C2)-methyltransferase